jgi:DNA-binding transcriptional regulator YhcF (GntR family)
MPDIFDNIKLERFQKSKRYGIVNGVLSAIENKIISKGDHLPSINKMIQRLGVARMTVVKAYNILKERGIVVSEDKVGYYIRDVNFKRDKKVFLFLTGFFSHQETLYSSIVNGINDPGVTVDLYFHHCNPKIFKSILLENLGSYSLYVVTAFDDPQVRSVLSQVPPGKLLQIIRPPLLEDLSSIYQDFGSELKSSLVKLKTFLNKYKKFILVFPSDKKHPEEIKVTFQEFCFENKIICQIENKVNPENIKKGCAFWVIEDGDLLTLIKTSMEKGLKLGNNLGVLSYNETPMKEIIRDGITVISIDFARMGKRISDFIRNPRHIQEIFSPEVIIRQSL